jgi:anti-sigma B factor antagonist
MQIEHSTEGDTPVLSLSGEIDLHASPALREELRARSSSKPRTLLVDFSRVEYIDSSGLATFIEYLRDAKKFDGSIVLFGMKKKVRTIFELVRLNELFPITGTREQALAEAANRR